MTDMKAIDTNILARFFINDPNDVESARQQPLAIAVMEQAVFVSITVVLEFEWVMRGFYKLSRPQITSIFNALLGFSHVTIEDRVFIQQALDYYQRGLDFADALHLVRARHCQAIVSFDQRFVKKARTLGLKIETPS